MLCEKLGRVDHRVGAVPGPLATLEWNVLRRSSDTKADGPLMLAKHLAPLMGDGGSVPIFSGVAAAKITVCALGVAITKRAADVLDQFPGAGTGPFRVNANFPSGIETDAREARRPPNTLSACRDWPPRQLRPRRRR